MKKNISVHQAKAHLSALISEIEQTGDTVVISRYGKNVAEISPFRRNHSRTRVNSALSKLKVKEDLHQPTEGEWEYAG